MLRFDECQSLLEVKIDTKTGNQVVCTEAMEGGACCTRKRGLGGADIGWILE